MKKKDMDTRSVLVELYENQLLSSKVNEALRTGTMTYEEIIELADEYGISISKSTLTRYKKKLEEHDETGVPLIDLIDKRKKNGNVVNIKEKRTGQLTTKEEREKSFDEVFDNTNKVYNDIQVLDEVIQKGYNGLQLTETIELPHMLRAMDTKAKITDNSLQGLSLVGLRELKLRSQAKTDAMLNAIMVYVPEEQHEELTQFIEEAEKEFYENLDLSKEDQRITEALSKAGLDF